MVAMMENTQITTTLDLPTYISQPEVIERFATALGGEQAAMVFVQSVLIVVQSSEPGEYSLLNCSNLSVVRAALRAVTLRVQVDPALRQAWLVPRKNKKTGKLEACLQLHYAEVRNRAMRTYRYRFINVGPVYAGETVYENIYNGLHQVQLASGTMTNPTPVDFTDGWVPVGSRTGVIIGWLGYSETVKATRQTVYMSVADIEAHIKSIQSWGMDTKAWKNNRQTMERKTVLLALLRKEDLGAAGMDKVQEVLAEVDDESETVDGEPKYVFDENSQAPGGPQLAPVVLSSTVPTAATPLPVAHPVGTQVHDPKPFGKKLEYRTVKDYLVKGRPLMSYTTDELREHANWEKCAASTKAAISVVIAYREEVAARDAERASNHVGG